MAMACHFPKYYMYIEYKESFKFIYMVDLILEHDIYYMPFKYVDLCLSLSMCLIKMIMCGSPMWYYRPYHEICY